MATSKARRKAVPDMRTKKQVTVRMTLEFAQDLNLLFAAYGLDNASFVVQQSVAAQADYVRQGMAQRQAAMQAAQQDAQQDV